MEPKMEPEKEPEMEHKMEPAMEPEMEPAMEPEMEPEVEPEIKRENPDEMEMELDWPEIDSNELEKVIESSGNYFSSSGGPAPLLELTFSTEIKPDVVRDVNEVGLDLPEVIESTLPQELNNLHVKYERTKVRHQPYNAHQRPLGNNPRLRQPQLSMNNPLSSVSLRLPKKPVQLQQ